MSTRTPWYESDNPDRVARGFGARLALWIVAAVVFFGVLGGAIWFFQVATSDAKGRGDATRTVNSGGNRLSQQAYFQQTFNDIKQQDAKLDQLYADKVAKVEGADVRYSGAVSYCLGLVGDYNAAADKEIASKFRDTTLPAQIDTTLPETDCKAAAVTK